jgi:Na+/proline symporter
MLGGFLSTVTWVLWLKPHFYDLLEIIPGFIVGLALTISVSKLTQSQPIKNSTG